MRIFIARTLSCFVIPVVAIGVSGCRGKAPERTYAGFVREIFAPGSVADLDAPRTTLISTYDRTGGNNDFNWFPSEAEDGWLTLADLEGPGYLSRFWATGVSEDQEIHFLVDGERTPRIQITRAQLMDGRFPFELPLASWEQNCLYSYVPIPFEQSLKVVIRDRGYKGHTGWPRLFYHINWARLPDDMVVQSFPRELTSEDVAALEHAGQVLMKGRDGEAGAESYELKAEAGGSARIVLEGPAVIKELRITPDLSAIDSASGRSEALAGLSLVIRWDGSEEASVCVPLAAAVGSGWARVRFSSMYFGAESGDLILRFPMPFMASAEIEIANHANSDLPVKVDVLPAHSASSANNGGYFHASWNRSGPDQIGRPHRVLSARGRGRYAGCILGVTSLEKSWWILESDESIRIDDEAIPGWLGTGLEDYFNGGWYYSRALARPLHGVVFRRPFQTLQYRLHLTDAVTFDKSIDVQFERGPNHASRGFMESVAFYYMDAPLSAGRMPEGGLPDPPENPLEEEVLMTTLINYEQHGDFEGAMNYLEKFLEENPQAQHRAVLELRMVAYKEKLHGFKSVKAEYERFKREYAGKEAGVQAEKILWFHGSHDRGLLGVFANAVTSILLNGEDVGATRNAQGMTVFPVELSDGQTNLSVMARFLSDKPWVQVCLRTHGDCLMTSPDWEWTERPDVAWRRYRRRGVKGPPEAPHTEIRPNAFVGMQSESIGIRPPGWSRRKPDVYLRSPR